MPIKADFNIDDIFNADQFIQNVEQTLFECLERTLIEIQSQAKMKVNANEKVYKDRTNVLNSSIGWVLYKDGEFLQSNFEQSGTGNQGNGNDGVTKGLSIAKDEAGKYSKGYVAVLVAGAEYAVYVESKGYDVLTGSWLEFDNIFQKNAQILKEATGINFTKNK